MSAERSLAVVVPELAGEWHPGRNGELTPSAVLPGSDRKIWWRGCADGHPPWLASPRDRVRGHGCPYCAGARLAPERSLAALRPQLAAEWHPHHNGALVAADVSIGSQRRVWWRCGRGHQWQARVSDRVRGTGCPCCAGKRVAPERSFAALHPELAAQVDRERSGGVDLASVAPRGGRRLWWPCAEGHVWDATVHSRVLGRSGCPVCADSSKKGILLADAAPALAREWVDVLNGGPCDDVVAGSGKRAWWRCPLEPSHLWRARVATRARRGTGCPYCAHTRVAPETSRAAARPDLSAQWHPQRNDELSPTDVLPSANQYVWWRCHEGHEWRARLAARSSSQSGCPACAAERRADHYVSDRSRLQPLRQWADEHGRSPTSAEWRAAGMRPHAATLRRHFGSWSAAIEHAGLTPRRRGGQTRWHQQRVLDALAAWTAEHGAPPTRPDWTRAGPNHPSANTVTRLFDTWTAALTAAGFPPAPTWTPPAIAAALTQWAADHDGVPTKATWRASDATPSITTINRHYGSWNTALAAAGLRG